MKFGTVTGEVSLQKTANCLENRHLLVVEHEGGSFVATDHAGARIGDRVVFLAGTAASKLEIGLSSDAAVVAVVK